MNRGGGGEWRLTFVRGCRPRQVLIKRGGQSSHLELDFSGISIACTVFANIIPGAGQLDGDRLGHAHRNRNPRGHHGTDGFDGRSKVLAHPILVLSVVGGVNSWVCGG